MKKVISAIICLITSLTFFSSCDNDGYSLDDMYIYLATVNEVGDNSIDLTLDDGTKLWPTNIYSYNVSKNKQRAVAYFTVISDKQGEYDHYIVLHRLYNILTKDIIDLTKENQDSIGNDPIKINRYWQGDDYLNIEFTYKRSGEDTHFINLVNNITNESINNEEIHLEFRHNSNNDPQRNEINGMVAFDLRPYKKEMKDFLDFIIKVNDFDGEKTYKFTYRPKTFKKADKININNISDATQYK